jgi:hypothetical protein
MFHAAHLLQVQILLNLDFNVVEIIWHRKANRLYLQMERGRK